MSNTPIGNVDMPDPWMIAHSGRFYLTFTLGNRIEIWSSHQMENFQNANKAVVWQPTKGSDWSTDIWAPELHLINQTWCIYTAGAKPGVGNPSHRTLVLRSCDADPMNASTWTFLGPLRGLPDHWHIDATVFSPRHNELYCCYSGWPIGDDSDTEQHLFLVKLVSPEEADLKTLTTVPRATLAWERPEGGRRGINEGPTWVSTSNWNGIVFSASGSWTNEYKLGLLELCGHDLLREDSWRKREAPLLISDLTVGGPFGPGHASFIHSPYNDGRIYCIFHGTEKPDEGWNNRKARVVNLGPDHFHPSLARSPRPYSMTPVPARSPSPVTKQRSTTLPMERPTLISERAASPGAAIGRNSSSTSRPTVISNYESIPNLDTTSTQGASPDTESGPGRRSHQASTRRPDPPPQTYRRVSLNVHNVPEAPVPFDLFRTPQTIKPRPLHEKPTLQVRANPQWVENGMPRLHESTEVGEAMKLAPHYMSLQESTILAREIMSPPSIFTF